MQTFKIANKLISNNSKTFIIAEIGLAHMGSLNIAHSFIDAAAKFGADAVKFQMHIASEESTVDEKFRIRISSQYKSRYEYWEKTSFKNEEWNEIINHCKKKKIIFLCTPFSIKAAEILENFNIKAFKIGSGEILFHDMFDYLKKTKKPILISTGLAKISEIDDITKKIKSSNPFAIFQCTSLYPTPPEKVGLNLINEFKLRYKCPVGLSDHSGNIYSAISAIALGANLIEVHISFDKSISNPDSSSSITFTQLGEIVNASKFLNISVNNKVNKNKLVKELSSYRKIFFRSLSLNKSLKKGNIIGKNDLTLKKPGTGIPPNKLNLIVGKKLKKNVKTNKLLNIKDFENE